MVPVSSIILMVLNALLGIAIPVLLVWWMVGKRKARLSTILIGAATFFVFALVLEALVHQLVLNGPHGAAIRENTLYYALYGGLMAGLFEETGRFLSMKFLLKKEDSAPLPGLAYGVGHGGAEMLLLFGMSMISALVMSILINTGQSDVLLSSAPDEALDQLTAQFEQLETTGAGSYLFGLMERISALLLHLGLSILVWAAVRRGGKWLWLFPAAILLHALVDGLAVILMKSVGMASLELIILSMALAVAALASLVARKAFPKEAVEALPGE